ncbi:MAG: hypothetical protein JJE04_07225 [Acidobacteriia bacterium]|nr:hypothetical protein [Terriglobia bacterium]
MISEWLPNGDLPPGVHPATWPEIEKRLAFNPRRDLQNVDDAQLDPVFWDFSQGRVAQKRRFLSEFFPAQPPEGATGRAFVNFFQVNKLTGEPKGIVAIKLGGSGRK